MSATNPQPSSTVQILLLPSTELPSLPVTPITLSRLQLKEFFITILVSFTWAFPTSYGSPQDFTLRGYCDVDYAGDHDDRKSRTRYLFLLENGAIAWCSKRQGCIADSTIEVEFSALAESVKEAIWLRHLHILGFPSRIPTPIFFDNQGAIQLVKNPKYHKRTKHIETKYYLVREKYECKQIDVYYINTKQQLTDLLTQALPQESFQHL